MKVAIVADDLTGAADTAVEFMAPGRRVQIVLDGPVDGSAEVLAVDIDSREVAAHVAAGRVHQAVRALAPLAPACWYKKLDSTLRGNVTVELQAFAQATRCPLLIVAPAYPAQGRGLVAGALTSEEQPDACCHHQPNLPDLLAAGGSAPVLMSLETVRDGPAAIVACLRAAPVGAMVIADAVTDADLDGIVAAGGAVGPGAAYAGSAGLAAAIGRVLGPRTAEASLLRGPASVLLLVGSLHPVSRRQLAQAAVRFGRPLLWSPSNAIEGGTAPFRAAIEHALQRHGVVMLTTAATVLANGHPRAIADNVASAAAAVIRDYSIRRVFCTGGELARALCNQLQIHHLAIRGRVLEGMPAMTALDGLPGLELVTKAGGFGEDDALLRAYAYLAGKDVLL